jgi:hypothetical protein
MRNLQLQDDIDAITWVYSYGSNFEFELTYVQKSEDEDLVVLFENGTHT